MFSMSPLITYSQTVDYPKENFAISNTSLLSRAFLTKKKSFITFLPGLLTSNTTSPSECDQS
jgi:hypothetical protein